MRRALLALLVLAVLAPLVAANASAAGPLIATVSGPAGVAPGQKAYYNVSVAGGPEGNVTYSVSYHIAGSNTTGGSPRASSPGHATGNGTTFEINITAPSAEQDLTLLVTVSAQPRTGAAENTTASYAITVIKSIALSATFHNGSSTAAANVTVLWYVDGSLVGTNQISRIGPNADATASFSYLPVGLQPGQHTVRVEADLDHDGVIDPARGEVVTSTLFYKEVQPLSTGWTILLGIGIFVPVFLGVVALRRRGQR